MRTLTTGQQTVLESASYWVSLRVKVEDTDGLFQDLSDLSSINWVDGAEWDLGIDQPVSEARVFLRRDHGDLSLAPLDEDSELNRDLYDAYAPLLDPGREIKIEVATTATGTDPSAGDWVLAFHGKIDAVRWERSPVEIVARDLASDLVDGWVETETEYGSEAGTAIETVIQDIIDDWAPGITLYTPTSPSFLVTSYEQQIQSVMDAIKGLVSLIGWDCRFVYDAGTSAFRLTLYEPDRTPASTAWTFGPSDYFDVTALNLDRTHIRNAVKVTYVDTAGEEQAVTVSDTTSIGRYGRRWMEIVEGSESPINTLAEATTLADAALADLKDPEADQEIETLFWWPGELGDYYEFTANGVHYSTDQEWAVVGIRHTLSRDRHRTFIRARGAPAGQYMGWLKKGKVVTDFTVSPFLSIAPVLDKDGNVSAAVFGNEVIQSIKITANARDRTAAEDPPTESEVRAQTAMNGTAFSPATVGSLVTLTANQVGDIAAFGYTAPDGGGVESALFTARSPQKVPDEWVDTDQLADGAVYAIKLRESSRKFSLTGTLAPSDWQTISYTGGTLYLADGTSHTINSGTIDLSSSSSPRFIYFDGTSTLALTNSLTTATAEGNILLALCRRAADSAQDAFLVGAVGIAPTINSTGLGEEAVQFNNIAANAVRAVHIYAAQIQAIHMDIDSLDAISADIGTVTAGTISTDVAIAAESFTAPTVHVENQLRIGGTSPTSGGLLTSPTVFSAAASYTISCRVTPNETLTLANFGKVNVEGDLDIGGDLQITADLNHDGSYVGFYGTAPAAKPTVTGSRGGNAALASLLTALAGLGLVTDSSS